MNAQELKDNLGVSTAQLARFCGVHWMTMQKWLTGERPPSAAVLRLFGLIAWLHAHSNLEQAMRDLGDARRPERTTRPLHD